MKFLTPKNFSRHCFVGDNDDGDNSDNGVDDVDGDDYHSNGVGDGFLVRDENKNNGKERGKKRQKSSCCRTQIFIRSSLSRTGRFPDLKESKLDLK